MIKLQKDSCALGEAETTKRAATILGGTEFLELQSIPDVFTSVDDVDEYMDSCPDSKEKNTRLYIEVRFHRMTPTRKKELCTLVINEIAKIKKFITKKKNRDCISFC